MLYFMNNNKRLEVLFQFYLWDQPHVTIVRNTRETGDMNNLVTISYYHLPWNDKN